MQQIRFWKIRLIWKYEYVFVQGKYGHTWFLRFNDENLVIYYQPNYDLENIGYLSHLSTRLIFRENVDAA